MCIPVYIWLCNTCVYNLGGRGWLSQFKNYFSIDKQGRYPQGPHSQILMMGGGGGGGPTEVHNLYPKNHNFRICLPKKITTFLAYPKKFPASFTVSKKSLLARISDPKKSLWPPVIKICEWGPCADIYIFSNRYLWCNVVRSSWSIYRFFSCVRVVLIGVFFKFFYRYPPPPPSQKLMVCPV